MFAVTFGERPRECLRYGKKSIRIYVMDGWTWISGDKVLIPLAISLILHVWIVKSRAIFADV